MWFESDCCVAGFGDLGVGLMERGVRAELGANGALGASVRRWGRVCKCCLCWDIVSLCSRDFDIVHGVIL